MLCPINPENCVRIVEVIRRFEKFMLLIHFWGFRLPSPALMRMYLILAQHVARGG